MDRAGMQSVAFLVVLACSVVYVLNSGSSEGDGGGPRALDSAAKASVGIERLQMAAVSSGELMRRRLLQSSDQGYIGYGALSGDNVPCPPQSGRSYYTPNCQSASGPVNPYTRGCSTITRCARN